MLQGLVNAQIVRTENCSDRIYDRHCHAHYGILFVLEGSIRLQIEGQPVFLEENMGVLIPPLKYHIVTGNNTRYHRLILSFQKECIPEEILGQFLENTGSNFIFRSESLSGLLRKFAAVLEKGSPVYTPLLGAILTEAIYEMTFAHGTQPAAAADKFAEKLARIIAYVDGNLHTEIRLPDVAAYVYMSESALSHFFKDAMKISLKQYILQKKMIYAQSLLHQGLPPGEAAAACGYKNYASFYKIFLKITGQTPAQLRQEE